MEVLIMKNIIGVKFEDDGLEYAFGCFDEVGVGDLVIVDTRYGFKLAKVTSADYSGNYDISHDLKEVVCKVDVTKFNERKERAKRLKILKRKMDAQLENIQTIALYEMLAEKNPEIKSLFTEFKELSGLNEEVE